MAKRKPVYKIESITTIYEKRVPDRVKELAAQHINQESLRLITNIESDMRKRIQKVLRKGEREGRSVSAIASKLLKTGLDKGVFRSARSRCWMIARTELHRARQLAALDVYRANKITKVRWVTICDDRRCKVCKRRHNKIFNINMINPPPKHPRCRCRLVPKDMEADIRPKKGRGKGTKAPTPQNYRYVIMAKALSKAAYAGNLGFVELYRFLNNAPPEAVKRYQSFLSRGRVRAAVAELERFVGYKLHPSVWQRFKGGKYETVHSWLTKGLLWPHKQVFHKDPEKIRPGEVSSDYYTRLRLGKLEQVKKPAIGKFRIHFADGTKHEVEASTRWSALQQVKHLSKLAPIKVEELEKALPYVRVRKQRLEHVSGYAGKPRLADLTPVERIETYLDPERPDVQMANRVATEVAAVGGRAIFIGGCVRDALLGRVSKDVDVEVYGVTAEKLQEMLGKLGKVDAVGRSFGVLKLSTPELSQPLDISIPRRDNKTGKGHKGFIVETDPTMTVREAARRRDLTINSIAYDPVKKEIIDEFGGLQDLQDKKLRATDQTTFVEDPLRVLRVMQFAARLGFLPDVPLAKLCRTMDLTELPKERVYEEVQKLMLKSKYPSIGLGLIPALGINKIMPEIDALRGVKQEPDWHPEGTAWKHTLMVVDAAAKLRGKFKNDKDKIVLMLAAMCHDLGKPSTTEVRDGKITTWGHDDAGVEPTRQLLGRISNDSEIQQKVEQLVREHLKPTFFHHDDVPDSAIRRLAKRVDIPLLIALSMADKLGRGGPVPDLKAERWLIEKYKTLKLDQPKALDPLVLGRHMIQMGMTPGPEMGRVLKQIYEAQLEGKFATPEDGVAYAQQQGWVTGKVYDVNADWIKAIRVYVPESVHHKAYTRTDPRQKQMQFPQNTPPSLINYTELRELGQVYQKEFIDGDVKDPQGNKIVFTEKNFLHITKLDTGVADKYRCERLLWIKDIIQNPDLIVKDRRDPEARLFLKWYKGEPYLFVCRVAGNQFHSVTAYPLESEGKLKALLSQERVYTRPGVLLKAQVSVRGFTRTRGGRLEPVRPYVMSRDQIRAELKQDREIAAKKHGVDSPTRLRFEGPFLSKPVGKYIYQWTIIQPGHSSHGSTVSGKIYELPKSTKKEGESMDKNFAMVLDPERFKKKMAELKKAKLLGKKIPIKTKRGLQFYKVVKDGFLVKGQGRMARLGDNLIIKGAPAKITALGRDGVTARDVSFQKYQVFYKDVELIRTREELKK